MALVVLLGACSADEQANAPENVVSKAAPKGHAAQIADAVIKKDAVALAALTEDRIVYLPRPNEFDMKKVSAERLLKSLGSCSVIRVQEVGAQKYVEGESVELTCRSSIKGCGWGSYALWNSGNSKEKSVYKLQYIADDFRKCAPTVVQMVG